MPDTETGRLLLGELKGELSGINIRIQQLQERLLDKMREHEAEDGERFETVFRKVDEQRGEIGTFQLVVAEVKGGLKALATVGGILQVIMVAVLGYAASLILQIPVMQEQIARMGPAPVELINRLRNDIADAKAAAEEAKDTARTSVEQLRDDINKSLKQMLAGQATAKNELKTELKKRPVVRERTYIVPSVTQTIRPALAPDPPGIIHNQVPRRP